MFLSSYLPDGHMCSLSFEIIPFCCLTSTGMLFVHFIGTQIFHQKTQVALHTNTSVQNEGKGCVYIKNDHCLRLMKQWTFNYMTLHISKYLLALHVWFIRQTKFDDRLCPENAPNIYTLLIKFTRWTHLQENVGYIAHSIKEDEKQTKLMYCFNSKALYFTEK